MGVQALGMGRSAKIVRCAAFEKQKRAANGQEWKKSQWKDAREKDKQAKREAQSKAMQEKALKSALQAAPGFLVTENAELGPAKPQKEVNFAKDAKFNDGPGRPAAAMPSADMEDAEMTDANTSRSAGCAQALPASTKAKSGRR